MKKKVVIIVAVSLLVVATAGAAVGYSIFTKKAINKDTFASKVADVKLDSDDIKLNVADATDKLEKTDKVSESVTATRSYGGYNIYFTKMSSKQDAINAFDANRKDFKILEETANEPSSEYKKGINFHTYELSTESKYCIVSQVDDTFVFAQVDKSFKDEVSKIISDLGY